MNVKVDIDAQKILKRFGLGRSDQFRLRFASNIARRCDKYVPMDTGVLKNTVQISSGGHRLIYPQKYAQKQYTIPYRRSDPNRGNYWDKRMMSNEGDKLEADMQAFVDRR